MIITLIAAMARDRIIGAEGGMPWHLPREMKHFVRSTQGKPIIVGRTTFASWGGRALPRRLNIVLTTDPAFEAPRGAVVANTIEQALELAGDAPEVMICGGGIVYEAFLPRAQRMILTHIEADLEGDTRFPSWTPEAWRITAEEHFAADEKNTHGYTIRWYVRNLTPASRTEVA